MRNTLPILCVLLALASGCSSSSNTDTSNHPPMASSALTRDTSPNVSSEDLAALRDGNTAFAADLYATLRNDPSFANKNLFFSPYSISVALAMTYAGARGQTASELKNTMHFTLPNDQLHAAFNAVDLSLSSRRAATNGQVPLTLNVANSMWGAPQTTFEQPFLDTLAVDYGTGVYLTDFAKDPEAARTTINDWVANKTNDKIQNLLRQGTITALTRFVLVNAVYFNGDWSSPFSPHATTAGTFHGVNGDGTAQMMMQYSEFLYGEGTGWRGVKLPYNGGLVFTAILPDDFTTFESSLDVATLANIDSSFTNAQVNLTMPKFEIKGDTFSLASALKTLGTTTLFGEADLSGMSTSESLSVGDVLHQAFVRVDEKGTEAAAATVVIGIGSSAPPELQEVTLTIDKPFVFFIRDNATGTILFQGRYVGD